MNKIKCTLIIATYNWPRALKVCLQSVMHLAQLPDEIIIADDGSNDKTSSLINEFKQQFAVPLIHIWHEDKGFRKTMILNKAIRAGSFEYIIQIDGDVILEKNFISDHLASAEKKTFIRGTRAMLTPQRTERILESGDPSVSIFSGGIKHRNNALRLFAIRALGTRKEMSSNSVRGSNISYWRLDFIAINGYNNDIAGWGHEDEELAARFINAGIIKKIVKLCAIQYHLYHPPVSKSNEPWQRGLVEKVKDEKIIYCANGYQQIT